MPTQTLSVNGIKTRAGFLKRHWTSAELITTCSNPDPITISPPAQCRAPDCLDGTKERKDTHIKTQFFLPSWYRVSEKLDTTPTGPWRVSSPLDLFFCTFTITCHQSQNCSFKECSLFCYCPPYEGFPPSILELIPVSKGTFKLLFTYSLMDSYAERKPSTVIKVETNRYPVVFFYFPPKDVSQTFYPGLINTGFLIFSGPV